MLSQSIMLQAGTTYLIQAEVTIQNYGSSTNVDPGTISMLVDDYSLYSWDPAEILGSETLADSISVQYTPATTSAFTLKFGFERWATNSGPTIMHWLDNVNVTPEPSSLGLLVIGGLALLVRRRSEERPKA